jgi:hypothetical protein
MYKFCIKWMIFSIRRQWFWHFLEHSFFKKHSWKMKSLFLLEVFYKYQLYLTIFRCFHPPPPTHTHTPRSLATDWVLCYYKSTQKFWILFKCYTSFDCEWSTQAAGMENRWK